MRPLAYLACGRHRQDVSDRFIPPPPSDGGPGDAIRRRNSMKKNMSRLQRPISVLIGGILAAAAATSAHAAQNYGEALQKSIYFYEAQQAGKLPAWNRVPWRGDSVLKDGADVGLNLSGGWYDAGDHVKFGFPMAGTATMLAWGAVDYRSGYVATGQLDELLNNLRFVNDFFIAAHPSPNILYGQIGQGNADHAFWGPPEVVEEKTSASRIAYNISTTCKGPDLASETAAAMAASSMVFKATDATYSATLLTHAKQLYALAVATVGTNGVENNYANCITDAKNFYNAGFGVYWDEMAWGALWLYRATGDTAYLDKFREYYPKMGSETGTTTPVFTWSQGWNDKAYGTYVLAAGLLNEAKFHTDAQRYLDHWSTGAGRRTGAGLMVVDPQGWGTNRYAGNAAFLALYYADKLGASNPKSATYKTFGKRQIDYILGDNPRNSSYVVGYGLNPPRNVHHRGAHGSWANSISTPAQSRHIIYGALVGGPASTSDTDYADDRSDFKRNEVAVDYNSGFTSALARLAQEYGGTPIPDAQFPPNETAVDEIFTGAKLNASGANFVEIKAVLQNKSTTPAQVRRDLRFRYFVDLTEVYAAGLTAANVTVTAPFNQGSGFTQLKPWGNANNRIFYTEIAFDGVAIYPGGLSEFRKEVQFRMSLPAGSTATWNNANDPSWESAFTSTTEEFGVIARKIPVYGGDGTRLFGQEPTGGCGAGTGVNCLPVAMGSSVTTAVGTSVAVTLKGTDSDGTIASYAIATAPANGTLSGTGASRTYAPKAGFSGADSFTFTVTDNAGGVSAPATVNITVGSPPVNKPPVACFSVKTASPKVGVPVEFDAACSTDPDNDPLTYAWNFGDGTTGTGGQTSHIYATAGTFNAAVGVADGRGGSNGVAKAVMVAPSSGSGNCTFAVVDQWNTGFNASITITNTGTSAINGWTVNWTFADGSKVVNLWNATVSGANPYSASNLSWNARIEPGQSVAFGFTGQKGTANAPAPTTTVTGAVCR
jgi:endoglucanase